jgi:hypothetical protein
VLNKIELGRIVPLFRSTMPIAFIKIISDNKRLQTDICSRVLQFGWGDAQKKSNFATIGSKARPSLWQQRHILNSLIDPICSI